MTGKRNPDETSIRSQEQGMSKVPFFTRGLTRQMICNKFELQFTFKLNRLRWKVTSLFLLLGMTTYNNLSRRLIDIEPVPSLMGKKTGLLEGYNSSQGRPKRKIVLLGPHERYNFGDLLFEKVLSKLLTTELGYEEKEIIRGATIARDMSVHGGYHNVMSMKKIQEMSRKSAAGPFDIIYTGGEALGCDFESGVNMLPTAELRQGAIGEKVYDCAYLFPKELLLPLDNEQNPNQAKKNVAIVNSMGGYPGIPACKAAADSADYVAFRDLDPLVPDPAVMVRELFYDDVISKTIDEVKSSIFPEGEENKKYIAVQFKKNYDGGIGYEKMAKHFDEIARNTKCMIVFFAAGTAPTHDSFESYKQVASYMTEPNFVYEMERVWNVVATIAGSEAVLGTSLHVRIMSFIFHKPRVTWCSITTPTKHSRFINRWDAPDFRTCGSVPTSWTMLSKYMGSQPEVTQEQTKEVYELMVKKYMEGFSVWANLLNDSNERLPSDHFCPEGESLYMDMNQDLVPEVVTTHFDSAFAHYTEVGRHEGRSYFCDF